MYTLWPESILRPHRNYLLRFEVTYIIKILHIQSSQICVVVWSLNSPPKVCHTTHSILFSLGRWKKRSHFKLAALCKYQPFVKMFVCVCVLESVVTGFDRLELSILSVFGLDTIWPKWCLWCSRKNLVFSFLLLSRPRYWCQPWLTLLKLLP